MTEPDLPDDELDPTLQERFVVLDAIEPPDTWPGAGRRPVVPGRRWIAAAAVLALIAGSLAWVLTRDDDTDVAAGDAADSPVGSEPSTFVCPVTVPPEPGFTPPDPWPADPSVPDAVWYGTDELWTVLELDGHTPRKSVWWSAEFPGGAEEERPPIAVVYERLDATADIVDLGPDGTNANTAQDGWFMIAGGQPDTPGCWQATATYKGATLSYVYELSDRADADTAVVDPSSAASTELLPEGFRFVQTAYVDEILQLVSDFVLESGSQGRYDVCFQLEKGLEAAFLVYGSTMPEVRCGDGPALPERAVSGRAVWLYASEPQSAGVTMDQLRALVRGEQPPDPGWLVGIEFLAPGGGGPVSEYVYGPGLLDGPNEMIDVTVRAYVEDYPIEDLLARGNRLVMAIQQPTADESLIVCINVGDRCLRPGDDGYPLTIPLWLGVTDEALLDPAEALLKSAGALDPH